MAHKITRTTERPLATVDVEDDGTVSLLTFGGMFPAAIYLTADEARNLAQTLTAYSIEADAYQGEQKAAGL